MSPLTWNRYGKSSIRLVKVRRSGDSHELVDLTIDVQLEGAFDAVYVDGDNSSCLATDTMKNTVYALARQDRLDHIETFASRLATHFLTKPAVTGVRIGIVEQPWTHIPAGGGPHPHAFVHAGAEQWTAVVTASAAGVAIVSGLSHLVLLKTTDSAFAGFPRDEYTTLPDTEDRIMATSVTANWAYRSGMSDFSARALVRRALTETFATHVSRS